VRAVRRVGAKLELASLTFPNLAPGMALVRPVVCAVASPDVAVAEGRADFQGVLGHECVGIVEQVAQDESRQTLKVDATRWVGKRVVVHPVVACGTCDLCRHGAGAHCPRRTVMGLHGRDGCFADVFVAPVANLVEVPKRVSDAAAACASTVAGALHACAMVRVEHKPFVTVLGDGPMALVVAQVLAKRNASVRLLGLDAAKFSLCEKWGIKHRHVAECGLRQDQDVVIDCTGSSRGTQTALSMLRPLGKLIVKGWPCPAHAADGCEGRVALSRALAEELTIVGAGAGSTAAFGEALLAMERGELDVESLILRRFRLADWLDAYAVAREAGVVKVVVCP
jgi:threonine dehydrogenase-like Zn-dependent dehydrogenase